MARYSVRKLDLTREDVRQKSFQILFAAFNENEDRSGIRTVLPKKITVPKQPDGTEAFGVFQGAAQIGFALLGDLKDGAYRISHVAVDPAFRHDGAGRKLVHAMLRTVVSRGGETVILQTDDGNKLQRNWFRSMGFSILKRGTNDGASLVLTVDDRIRTYLSFCEMLDKYANLVYGFYGVDEDPYADTYPVALVLMQPYRCSPSESDERYHELIVREKERLNSVLRAISNDLTDRGIPNLPMPLPREDVDESLARKAAALRAGLGWLGKNDRVVHRIYGSKTVTCRIYIGADFPVNAYPRRNACGECRACVDACPVECLKDKKWSSRVSRKEVIDEAACLAYRLRAYQQTGCYAECDRCVRCCNGKK